MRSTLFACESLVSGARPESPGDSLPCLICPAKHFSQLLPENDLCRKSSTEAEHRPARLLCLSFALGLHAHSAVGGGWKDVRAGCRVRNSESCAATCCGAFPISAQPYPDSLFALAIR